MVENCLSLLLTLTLHVGMAGEFNGINPHVRCDIDNYSTGMYYNSEKNISFYVSRNVRLPKSEIEIGLVTGYKNAKALPLLRWKKNNWFIAPMYATTWHYTEYPDRTTSWFKGEKDTGILIGYEMKIGKRK